MTKTRLNFFLLPIIFLFTVGCNIDSINPKHGSINNGTSPTITVKFTSAINTNSINSNTIQLYKGQYEYDNIFGKISYDPHRFIATFKPYDRLEKDQAYTLVLNGVEYVSTGSSFEMDKYRLLFFTTNKILHKGFTYTIITSPKTGKKWLKENIQNLNQTAYYQWGSIMAIQPNQVKRSTHKVTLKEFLHHDYTKKSFVQNNLDDWIEDDPLGEHRQTLWNDSSGFICPVGFKIPTAQELEQEIEGLSSHAIETHFLTSTDGFYTNNGVKREGFSNIRLWSTDFSTNTKDGTRYSFSTVLTFGIKHHNNQQTPYAYTTNHRLTDALPIRCIEN